MKQNIEYDDVSKHNIEISNIIYVMGYIDKEKCAEKYSEIRNMCMDLICEKKLITIDLLYIKRTRLIAILYGTVMLGLFITTRFFK